VRSGGGRNAGALGPHEAARAEMLERGWAEVECQAAARGMALGSPVGARGRRSARVDPLAPYGWREAFRQAQPVEHRLAA
jgi:hypothetical protein